MSSDWFARKLAGGRPVPAATPQQYAPPSYPQGPAAPPYIPPTAPTTNPQVTKENIHEVAGLWKGGKGTKTETQPCPNCGGNAYFSMTNGVSQGGAGARIATERGMAATSPRCFECGFNSVFGLQTGSM